MQVGTINYRNNQCDVVVKTLTPDEKHTVNGVSIDALGRNIAFFVTRGVAAGENKGLIK